MVRLRCRGAGEQRGERDGEPRLLEVGDGLGMLWGGVGGAERARTWCAGGGFGVLRAAVVPGSGRGSRGGKGESGGGTVLGLHGVATSSGTEATMATCARVPVPWRPSSSPTQFPRLRRVR